MVATQAGVELGPATYHQDSGTFRFEFEPDVTRPSMAVVAALSEVMDVDPVELVPLQQIVDTDALDAIVRVRERTVGDISVTFAVHAFSVAVFSYGIVAVSPSKPDPTGDPNQDDHR